MPPYTPDSPNVITNATAIKIRRIPPRPSTAAIKNLGSTIISSNESLIKENLSDPFDTKGITNKNIPLTYIKNGDFDIVWHNCFIFTIAHLIYFYSLYYILVKSADVRNMYTWMFGYFVGVAGGLGITAGAHRLWSHKSYEARLQLRIFLMIGTFYPEYL